MKDRIQLHSGKIMATCACFLLLMTSALVEPKTIGANQSPHPAPRPENSQSQRQFPLFGIPFNFDVLGNGKKLVAGDFNRDGKPDFGTIVKINNLDHFVFLPGDGNGGFGTAQTFRIFSDGTDIAARDVDGDGKLDISAVGGLSTNDFASLLFGDTDLVFTSSMFALTNLNPKVIKITDVNRDGKPDLYTATDTRGGVSLNQGNRTFSASLNVLFTALPQSSFPHDFNGDGKPDLIVAQGRTFKILLGNGDGTFQPPIEVAVPPEFPGDIEKSICPTDLDEQGNGSGGLLFFVGDKDLLRLNNNPGGSPIFTHLGKLNIGAPVAMQESRTTPTPTPAPEENGFGLFDGSNRQPGAETGGPSRAEGDELRIIRRLPDGTVDPDATLIGPGTRDLIVVDLNRDGREDLVTFQPGTTMVSVYFNLTEVSCQQATFTPSTGIPASNVNSVTSADFNQDGFPDLATVRSTGGNGTVSVTFGNGSGGFGVAADFVVGTGPNGIASGDFNRDSKPDLVTANTTANTVSILLNNGTGGFGTATAFSTGAGSAPRAVAVGDLNKDGRPDLAVASSGTNQIGILLGNGNGGFGAATNFGAVLFPTSVVVADFDTDGNPDVAVANRDSNNVTFRLGTGTGSLGGSFVRSVGTQPSSIAAVDVDRNGGLDLITANTGGTNLSVLFNDGFASFGNAVNFTSGTAPHSVQAADVNQDGKPDLVAVNTGAATASVLLGDGAGGFAAPVTFPVGTGPTDGNQLVLADFNGDLRPDVARANATSGTVSILINSCREGSAPGHTVTSFYPYASATGKTITVTGSGFVNGSTQVFFGGTRLIPATTTVVSATTLQVVVPVSATGAANANGFLTVRVNGVDRTTENIPVNAGNPGDPTTTHPDFVLWGDSNGDGLVAQASDTALARAFLLFQATPSVRQTLACDVIPLNLNGSRGNGQLTSTDFTLLRAVSFGQTTF